MWRIWRVYCGVTRGARNARSVQGNHQDGKDEKELLLASDHKNLYNQIFYYGTTDHKVSHSTHVNNLPKPPKYKWGSENYHKERQRHNFIKDASRLCKRQRRQQILLTCSVLQAFGWGSVFALSWTIWKSHSLYQHSKQQCPTQYWPFQIESSNVLFNNEINYQLLKVYDNTENTKKNQEIYSSSKKCYNYDYSINPDIDRSLFSYLYSVASNQPVIESNVKDKKRSSKRAHYRKRLASAQPDLEISTSEEHAHSQSYSHKLNKPDISTYQSNIDLQQGCLSQNCEDSKVVPCVNDQTTVIFEHSSNETENKNNQNQFSNKTEAKSTKEIVTIEDCSESGISSSISSDYKKPDASKTQEKDEDIKKIIQQEIKAIRAVQDKVNGLLRRDLGLSLVDIDPDSAVLHFQAGALLGDSDATYNLALCLHMGKGVKQNYKLARKYYSEASKAGHAWATYNLAVLVSEGLGGVADNDLAYALLQTAAERGVEQAKEALRTMEEEDDDDDDDSEDTGDIGIITSCQSLPTMHSEPSEKVNSSILDKEQYSQCIDVTNHLAVLTLSRDQSLTL